MSDCFKLFVWLIFDKYKSFRSEAETYTAYLYGSRLFHLENIT